MTDALAKGRFRGVYCVGNTLDARTHGLTPERDTIEEVITDLLIAQKRKRIVYSAQIINTATLYPIEPAEATIARLRQMDIGRSGILSSLRSAILSKSASFGTHAHLNPSAICSWQWLLFASILCFAWLSCRADRCTRGFMRSFPTTILAM